MSLTLKYDIPVAPRLQPTGHGVENEAGKDKTRAKLVSRPSAHSNILALFEHTVAALIC